MTTIERFALDTNILIYAEGMHDAEKRAHALRVLARIPRERTCIPVQVLGETFRVLLGKYRLPPSEVRARLASWQSGYDVRPTTAGSFDDALDLAVSHRLQVWDAVILASAADAGCRMLLSEDFQDGFVWRGVTVADPFRTPVHPLLRSLLED